MRILRRFLEQGSEVLCAAGALDPTATVSVVAMQVGLAGDWSRQRIERYRDIDMIFGYFQKCQVILACEKPVQDRGKTEVFVFWIFSQKWQP